MFAACSHNKFKGQLFLRIEGKNDSESNYPKNAFPNRSDPECCNITGLSNVSGHCSNTMGKGHKLLKNRNQTNMVGMSIFNTERTVMFNKIHRS